MNAHLFRGGLVLGLLGLASLFSAHADKPSATDGTRVEFPRDYATKFQVIRRTKVAQSKQVGTVYANDRAASITSLGQLPYPNGAVFVFEWSDTEKDASGAP